MSNEAMASLPGNDAEGSGSSKTLFNPEDVLRMAEYFGINLSEKKEYWLLEIAKQSIVAPLLDPWHEEDDASGNTLFVNSRYDEH